MRPEVVIAMRVTWLVVLAAEAICHLMILAAPHTSDAALDAAVILPQPVVRVRVCPLPNRLAQS